MKHTHYARESEEPQGIRVLHNEFRVVPVQNMSCPMGCKDAAGNRCPLCTEKLVSSKKGSPSAIERTHSKARTTATTLHHSLPGPPATPPVRHVRQRGSMEPILTLPRVLCPPRKEYWSFEPLSFARRHRTPAEGRQRPCQLPPRATRQGLASGSGAILGGHVACNRSSAPCVMQRSGQHVDVVRGFFGRGFGRAVRGRAGRCRMRRCSMPGGGGGGGSGSGLDRRGGNLGRKVGKGQ